MRRGFGVAMYGRRVCYCEPLKWPLFVIVCLGGISPCVASLAPVSCTPCDIELTLHRVCCRWCRCRDEKEEETVDATATAAAPVDASDIVWDVAHDAEGNVFFTNRATGESVWDRPEGFKCDTRVVSSPVLSYHVVSCRVVSCRVVSCRVVSCRVVSCRVVSCRVVSCRVILFA